MSEYVCVDAQCGGWHVQVSPSVREGQSMSTVCGCVLKGPSEACSCRLLTSQVPKEPVPRSLSQGFSSLQ